MTTTDLLSVFPLLILILWACLVLLLDVFLKRERLTTILTAIGLVVTLGFSISQNNLNLTGFNNMVVVDNFAVYLNIIFLGSGLLAISLAHDYLKRMGINRGEFYVLLMFSISGMMLMAIAADLIVFFLALELLSIPLYVLAAFARPRVESEEAGMKYFLLGAFSGGFVVYGIALVFGATATTNLSGIAARIAEHQADIPLLTIGAALILVGFSFKVAVVPFQMWTPDVYHGAPSAVTAFMAIGAKAAGFAALMRIFVAALPTLSEQITPIIWVLAALTMIVGNIVAVAQSNIKRMLAYSSIAHAGYILMALVSYGQSSVASVSVSAALFYLLSYAVTNFGAWAVVIAVEKAEGKGLALDDYAGIGRKYPALAAAMAIFMLSFTGVPPTLGFVGKFYLFRAVIDGGYIGLAVIGVLTSLISAFYYLRVVVIMYMRDGEPEVRSEPWLNLTTAFTAIATIVLSIFSAPILQWASQAILSAF